MPERVVSIIRSLAEDFACDSGQISRAIGGMIDPSTVRKYVRFQLRPYLRPGVSRRVESVDAGIDEMREILLAPTDHSQDDDAGTR